ncbi:hypothetical protein M422DRAFT_242627 [Sphaerobolus stellatus SS14]|nr:hypothetical protein M422DRAFT_242627 [Sphaerobolus stellatus SS14]
MFKLSALIVTLAALSTVVTAGGTIKFCTDNNLSGTCEDISYSDNVCINFDNTLNDEVSSLDPSGSGHNCRLFKDLGCQGDFIGFTEHHNTLPGFNDVASSFLCSS